MTRTAQLTQQLGGAIIGVLVTILSPWAGLGYVVLLLLGTYASEQLDKRRARELDESRRRAAWAEANRWAR